MATKKNLPKIKVIEDDDEELGEIEDLGYFDENQNLGEPSFVNEEKVTLDEIQERKTTVSLQLGDVIHLEDPLDDTLHNKTFYIDYIDGRVIKLIDVDDMSIVRLKVKENGQLGEGTITKISLLYRNDEPGYAKQNNLLPNTWVNIHFGGELPVIITGEITNIEEDMIEIRTYPEKDTIYINFACQGVPEDMNIDKIEIRKPPTSATKKPKQVTIQVEGEEPVDLDQDQDQDQDQEREQKQTGVEEDFGESVDEFQDDEFEGEDEREGEERESINGEDLEDDESTFVKPSSVGIKGLRGMILKADEVVTGRYMGKIKEMIDVDVSKQRFNITTQTNDLLDELISKVPVTARTENVKKNIHIMIERFKQLRGEYSTFDSHGIVTSSKLKTANWKPLANELNDWKSSLYWIIPIVKNIKKIYDISAKEETNYPDVNALDFKESLSNFIDELKQYDNITEQNKYIERLNQVQNFFTPFDDIQTRTDYAEDVLTKINATTELNVVLDNLTEFQSSVFKNAAIQIKKFAVQKYNTSLSYLQSLDTTSRSKFLVRRNEVTHGDSLALTSILTLPEPTIRFSHIQLPGTSILEKSNLHFRFLDYWRLLNKKTTVNPVVVSMSDINKGTNVTFNEENYVNDIKNYSLNLDTDEMEEGDETTERKSIRKMSKPEIYKAFTQSIVPQTKVLFNLMKKYIHGKLSLVNVVSYLEPFCIYTKDLTYMQYKTIQTFIFESIRNFNKNYVENSKLFKTFIKNNQNFSLRNSQSNSIITTLLPTYRTEIEDGYNYHSPFNSSTHRRTQDDGIGSFYLTNGELLTYFTQIDYGNLLNSALSLENVKLMFPKDLMKILEDEKSVLGIAVKDAEKANKCITYVLAKQYNHVDELNADNGKPVYYDKKYDTTDYSILNKYEGDRYKMQPDDFLPYFIEKLVTNHNFSQDDAEKEAETLLSGFKLVQDGDLAKVYDEQTTNITFYKREKNRWTKEDSITDDMVVDDPSTLCNFQKDCIDVEKKYGSVCESYDLNKKEIKENVLKDIVKHFDKKFQYSKDELEYIIHQQFDYSFKIVAALRELKQRNLMKYNNEQYNLGVKHGLDALNDTEQQDVVVSPYLPLRDLILGTSDFVKKQRNIVRFAKMFTREALPEESSYWRYCVLTNTQLLPTFFYTLAACFIETPNQYLRTMNTIMKESGKLSDDGDRWVDEHTGRTICMIDFAIDEGYEGGFKIVSRDLLEEDLGDSILNKDKKPVVFETAQTKKISNIITALSGFMGLKIEEQREFIIRLVNDVLVVALPNKQDYEKRAAAEEAKKPKGAPSRPNYEGFENMTVLYLTLGAFLIAVQVSVPSIKTKKTFPGCVRSFSGYPFEGEGDSSGLDYLVCVVGKISRSTEPWNSIAKVKGEVISKNLRSFINKYYCDPKSPAYNTVKQKFQEKTSYLLANPNIGNIPEEYGLLKRWPHFLPPLHVFKIKSSELNQVTEGFITSLKHDVTSGSRNQQEKILVLQSKVIFFSLELQTKIQKIIQKKQLLLTNGLNEPFLENACCNENEKVATTLQYFEKDDPEIRDINDRVAYLSKLINNIANIARAPYLFSRENTKNVYPSSSNEFSKKTIFRAFITFCKLNTSTPLDPNLQVICAEKTKKNSVDKDDLESVDDGMEKPLSCSLVEPVKKGVGAEPMQDVIQRLERDGVKYSDADFERLMNVVNKRNQVYVNVDRPFADVALQMRMGIQDVIDEKKPVDLVRLFKHIESVLDSSVVDLASTEDIREVRDLKNFLYDQNDKMKKEITSFLEVNSDISKKQMKLVKEFVVGINTWTNKTSDALPFISDDVTYSNIQFLKNTIGDMLNVFPTMLLNNLQHDDIHIGSYLGLSPSHQMKLVRIIQDYYEKLNPFYKNPIIRNVVQEIKLSSPEFISFVKNITYFTEIQYKDLRLPFLFDKTLSGLLMEYSFLYSCMMYVNLSKNERMLNGNELGDGDDLGEVEEIGNTLDLKRKVANMLVAFLQIEMDNKSRVDISYEEIMNNVFKIKEREKNRITDRLKSLTDEEREIDNVLKSNKLGEWGKGLRKGLTTYVAEDYDAEMEEMEKVAEMENRFRRTKGLYGDDNVEPLDLDEFQEQVMRDEDIERDEYDIGAMDQDYYDGRFGDYADAEGEVDNFYDDS
jgi:hypothetical protein